MSDAPTRRYKEFAEQNKHDKRIKTLQGTGTGFDKTIRKWLDAKSELTLHCAILYNPQKESDAPKYLALIKHLLDVSPESLEQKSSEGFTPLQLAVFAQREDIIEYLIANGANQRHRDKIGRNMLHCMVTPRTGGLRTDPKKLQSMIDLFDMKNIQEMFLERVSTRAGAQTPLALWMHRNGGHHPDPEFLEVLFTYSSGEDLEMIDGEGDLPLHLVGHPSFPCPLYDPHSY
jgi:ankyrin repeat protein